MIPSDHFVRFYNEVFKALDRKGRGHLVDYWRMLGRLQTNELGERFKQGGVPEALRYWQRIIVEENCQATLTDHGDWIEFKMHRCPSLSKALDNDAEPCELYCDHCMAWIEPVMEYAGLCAALDMESRVEPHCTFRVYADPAKAAAFERRAKLASKPYAGHLPKAKPPARMRRAAAR